MFLFFILISVASAECQTGSLKSKTLVAPLGLLQNEEYFCSAPPRSVFDSQNDVSVRGVTFYNWNSSLVSGSGAGCDCNSASVAWRTEHLTVNNPGNNELDVAKEYRDLTGLETSPCDFVRAAFAWDYAPPTVQDPIVLTIPPGPRVRVSKSGASVDYFDESPFAPPEADALGRVSGFPFNTRSSPIGVGLYCEQESSDGKLFSSILNRFAAGMNVLRQCKQTPICALKALLNHDSRLGVLWAELDASSRCEDVQVIPLCSQDVIAKFLNDCISVFLQYQGSPEAPRSLHWLLRAVRYVIDATDLSVSYDKTYWNNLFKDANFKNLIPSAESDFSTFMTELDYPGGGFYERQNTAENTVDWFLTSAAPGQPFVPAFNTFLISSSQASVTPGQTLQMRFLSGKLDASDREPFSVGTSATGGTGVDFIGTNQTLMFLDPQTVNLQTNPPDVETTYKSTFWDGMTNNLPKKPYPKEDIISFGKAPDTGKNCIGGYTKNPDGYGCLQEVEDSYTDALGEFGVAFSAGCVVYGPPEPDEQTIPGTSTKILGRLYNTDLSWLLLGRMRPVPTENEFDSPDVRENLIQLLLFLDDYYSRYRWFTGVRTKLPEDATCSGALEGHPFFCVLSQARQTQFPDPVRPSAEFIAESVYYTGPFGFAGQADSEAFFETIAGMNDGYPFEDTELQSRSHLQRVGPIMYRFNASTQSLIDSVIGLGIGSDVDTSKESTITGDNAFYKSPEWTQAVQPYYPSMIRTFLPGVDYVPFFPAISLPLQQDTDGCYVSGDEPASGDFCGIRLDFSVSPMSVSYGKIAASTGCTVSSLQVVCGCSGTAGCNTPNSVTGISGTFVAPSVPSSPAFDQVYCENTALEKERFVKSDADEDSYTGPDNITVEGMTAWCADLDQTQCTTFGKWWCSWTSGDCAMRVAPSFAADQGIQGKPDRPDPQCDLWTPDDSVYTCQSLEQFTGCVLVVERSTSSFRVPASGIAMDLGTTVSTSETATVALGLNCVGAATSFDFVFNGRSYSLHRPYEYVDPVFTVQVPVLVDNNPDLSGVPKTCTSSIGESGLFISKTTVLSKTPFLLKCVPINLRGVSSIDVVEQNWTTKSATIETDSVSCTELAILSETANVWRDQYADDCIGTVPLFFANYALDWSALGWNTDTNLLWRTPWSAESAGFSREPMVDITFTIPSAVLDETSLPYCGKPTFQLLYPTFVPGELEPGFLYPSTLFKTGFTLDSIDSDLFTGTDPPGPGPLLNAVRFKTLTNSEFLPNVHYCDTYFDAFVWCDNDVNTFDQRQDFCLNQKANLIYGGLTVPPRGFDADHVCFTGTDGKTCLVFPDSKMFGSVSQFLDSGVDYTGTTFKLVPFSLLGLSKLLLAPAVADAILTNAFVDLVRITPENKKTLGNFGARIASYVVDDAVWNAGAAMCNADAEKTSSGIAALETALRSYCDDNVCVFTSLETSGSSETEVSLPKDAVFPPFQDGNIDVFQADITVVSATDTRIRFASLVPKTSCNRFLIDAPGFSMSNIEFDQGQNCNNEDLLARVPIVFTGNSAASASITNVKVSGAELAVSAVGGTSAVVSFSPILDMDNSLLDISTSVDSDGGSVQDHVVAAFARTVGTVIVGALPESPYFCQADCASHDIVAIVDGAQDRLTGLILNPGDRVPICASGNVAVECATDDSRAAVVIGAENGVHLVSGGMSLLRTGQVSLAFSDSEATLFFIEDNMLHQKGRPYECLTVWASGTIEFAPCQGPFIGLDRPDVPLGGTLFSGDMLQCSENNKCNSDIPCIPGIYAGQPLLVSNPSLCDTNTAGLRVPACTRKPLQALYDVQPNLASKLCHNVSEVELTTDNGFGAVWNCAKKTLDYRGYGYSVFDSFHGVSPITQKVVIQPLSDAFSVIAPGLEIINITEFTSVFGNKIEQSIFQQPARLTASTSILTVLVLVLNLVLFLAHLGLIVYSNESREAMRKKDA